MDTKALRQKILDLAIRGKLVPQDPNDEPASVLLERIRAEKERLIAEGKIKRHKKAKSSSSESHYQNFTPPFPIPDSWEWVKLEDVASIGTGSTPSKGNKSYYGGNINWVGSSVTSKPFVYKPTDYITDLALKETNCVVYPIGTLVMAMYGEGKTRGQLTELKIEAATNQACAAIKPYDTDSKDFIKLFLLANYYHLRQLAEGGNQPNLNIGKIGGIYMPFPPIEEQRRIINGYNKLEHIINSIDDSRDVLSDFVFNTKSKILELAMQGKLVPQDPADEPAADMLRRVNPKARIITDNPHSRNIPEGWCVTTLSDLCVFLSRGKSPKYSDIPNQYPVFAQKCNLKEGGISLDQARFLDEATLDKWPVKYRLKTGDVLINSTGTGTVGRTRYFDECCLDAYPFTVPDSHVSVVRSFDEINSKYLFYCLYSPNIQQYFEDNLAGSTNQKELYIDIIGSTQIVLPPVSEQQRIVLKIEELYYVLDKIEASLQS